MPVSTANGAPPVGAASRDRLRAALPPRWSRHGKSTTSMIPAKVLGGIPYASEYARLAKTICNTEMVPMAFRGAWDKVMAAFMRGYELGLGPMQSLDSFNVIEGKVGLGAEAMRALIIEAGHQIILEEVYGGEDGTTVTAIDAACRRSDWAPDMWRTFSFYMQDALHAGPAWPRHAAGRRVPGRSTPGRCSRPVRRRAPAGATSLTCSPGCPTPRRRSETLTGPLRPLNRRQRHPQAHRPQRSPRRNRHHRPIRRPRCICPRGLLGNVVGPSANRLPAPRVLHLRHRQRIPQALPRPPVHAARQEAARQEAGDPGVGHRCPICTSTGGAALHRMHLRCCRRLTPRPARPRCSRRCVPACRLSSAGSRRSSSHSACAFLLEHFPDGAAEIRVEEDLQKAIDIAAGWPESADDFPPPVHTPGQQSF